MDNYLIMLFAIILGSAISLAGGATIFLSKKRRVRAINIALPFGAGALLAAAFFDLLPESFELGEPRSLLTWTLIGFTVFFILERTATWFHAHHDHDSHAKDEHQNTLVVIGDLLHNLIDGIAIGAAFLANPATGLITVLAVSVHEIPKELGTFGILLSRGWRDKKVIAANVLTAIATIFAATLVYLFGSSTNLPIGPLLAATAGMFIYIAASDIIPDIHEQPRKLGTVQAIVLVLGLVVVGVIIATLGV
ncbi:ZIP family metal transporter [Candidatus Saccharibacteria bacterium]|nr:ZIP family metal transporter [Candidatus Saccharibacteria bacterium]